MGTEVLAVPSPWDAAFNSLLCDSYERLLGHPLVSDAPDETDIAHWLYHDAPFAVLAQNVADDPVFVYANIAAQQCFGYAWDEFSGLPSRLSAPSADRAARERLMAGVKQEGYVTGYRGLRQSKSGRQFWIEDVTIWNLIDTSGTVRGQAALISSWSNT